MWIVNHKYKDTSGRVICRMWLVYVCIAYAIFSDDIVEQVAMGHAYIGKSKNIQGNVDAETQREKAIGKNKTKQRNK